jgi:hypothetical protein
MPNQNMPEQQLPWWPLGTSRRLRVFMSHRWTDDDKALFDQVFEALEKMGIRYQDTSLQEQQSIRGPRRGSVNEGVLMKEIASRIFTSDIFIVPSRPAAGKSEWVQWEVELAGICYSLPVLFVDHSEDLVYRSYLIGELESAGAKCASVKPDPNRIAFEIVKPRPYAAPHAEETGETNIYRGPLRHGRQGLQDVINRIPYQPIDSSLIGY